ncbi:hypothetical protein N7486_006331 [Penicillium sp. IBT 16267x]|nr:hypothetical protein N7486_006331 [Penicillium sp. IBT 16267x]
MAALRNSRAAREQVRGFATSPNLRVGPESPHFIDVPRILQPSNPVKPRVKGTLPTERTVNPKSNDPEKQAFKLKMAVLRRQHLREGLLTLYQRKTSAEQIIFNRSLESQSRRERILQQPEPEDERLTRSTVVQAMQSKGHSVLADPNREQRLALSKARVEALKQKKDAQRQEDLQSLYMNARTFIINEEQLAAEIDRVFPEGENEAWRNDHQQGENIWNLGTPQTVQSIVNQTRRSETARWDVIQDRVKQLGEQITGGKL